MLIEFIITLRRFMNDYYMQGVIRHGIRYSKPTMVSIVKRSISSLIIINAMLNETVRRQEMFFILSRLTRLANVFR